MSKKGTEKKEERLVRERREREGTRVENTRERE
jgi:hypothetical protein